MPPKKKPRSVLRNLFIVIGVFIPLLAVVLYARSLDRAVILIYPEEHAAREAQRQSPDNGFPLLLEAVKLLPTRPAPSRFPSSERGENPWEEPALGMRQTPGLPVLCGIGLNDGDPQILQYIEACGPAVAKAQEALQKPFLLFPAAREFRDSQYEEDITVLTRAMIALGRVRFEKEPTAEALAPLLDAIQLARTLCKNEFLFSWADNIEGTALQQLRVLGVKPEHYASLKATLDSLGPGYLPRRDALRTTFLHIDDQLARKREADTSDPGRNVFRGLFVYELQRVALILKQGRQILFDYADNTPWTLQSWLSANAKPSRGDHPDPFGIQRRINMSVWRAGGLQGEFVATQAALAVVAFQAETGAYPKTLEELVPKYFPQVPVDPYTNKPLGYLNPSPDAYTIYLFGIDATDHGGDPKQDRIIAMKRPPKPEPAPDPAADAPPAQ
jgi:hypothetical protein